MNNLTLDAAQCLLMAKIAARMDCFYHSLFWEILPDIVPDLTIHMPALIAAVRKVNQYWLLWPVLSFHPLPTTLPPETMNGRQELVNVWEEQLKGARKTLDILNQWECKSRYIYSLRGLTQVDRCDLPPGMTCSSVLPTLLGEVHAQRFRAFEPLEQLQCLAFLSDWRPGRNVLTDPTVLNEWVSFWLGLYHQASPAGVSAGEEALRIQIIKKGIAAKGLLNLMETGREKETVVPAGLETALLKSLTMAAEAVGEIPNDSYDLDWLSWQPRDVTRFPTDRLVQVPETLLKIFTLSCRDTQYSPHRRDSLTELVRWNRDGLSAACGIDLLPAIVTGMSNYLNTLRDVNDFKSGYLLNHEVCRWLVREEVANVEGGRELLQKLGRCWESESMSQHWHYGPPDSRNSKGIAWKGRMQLQRTGLATEPPDVFHNDLLKAITKEKDAAVRIGLSLWRPEKDARGEERRELESLWKKKLKSRREVIAMTSALSLLRPDPADDLVAWWQKLRSILSILPEPVGPELSVTEIMHLMRELPLENQKADPNAARNQRWQFRPDEMRFRLPMGHTTPTSTSATVQTARLDKTTQSITDGV